MSKGLYLCVFLIHSLILYYIFRSLKLQTEGEETTEESSKRVAILGGMAALSAMFQVAPVFLPVAGLLLSPFSSLPIAIGTLLYAKGALPMFLASAGIISIIYVEEGIIFLLATGPLGLASSLVVISNKPKWKKILIPSLILTSGILILIFIVGLAGLVEVVDNLHVITAMLAIFLFSIVYSCIWIYIVLIFKKCLLPFLKPHIKLSKEELSSTNTDTLD